MGTSTDAYLYYGIEVWDTDNQPEISDELAERLQEFETEDGLDIDFYIEQNLNVKGVEYDSHCHCEYPMYFIHTKKFSAWRGDPTDINLKDLTIDPKWNDKLKKACEQLGFEYEEPSWRLASYWG